jgi:hypothetical protein
VKPIVSRTWFRSPEVVELTWWHFAILVPTVAFKFMFLRKTTLTVGLWSILDSLGDGFGRWVNAAILVSADVLEVTVLVGVLYVIGRLILRIPSRVLRFASILLCLLIMGANHQSILQVANLMTVDTLTISVLWALQQPQILWHTLEPKLLGGGLFALGWAYFFTVLPSRPMRIAKMSFAGNGKGYPIVAWSILVLSGVGILTLPGRSARAPLVIGGYWSSATITFFQWDAPDLSEAYGDSLAAIEADYQALAFPHGTGPEPRWLVSPPPVALRPPHILIVALETAPRAYYPLLDDSSLVTMQRMSERAIVSDHHYATSPYTWWNIAAMVSGDYLMQKGRGVFDYGDVRFKSLASVLARHGYSTSYIDSFVIEWARRTGFWERFGFEHLLDNEDEDDVVPFDGTSFEVTAGKERRSFQRALGAILDANQQGRQAFVTLATTIGHYPWVSRPGEETRPGRDKLHAIAALFDDLLGDFLRQLEQNGLQDEIIIVVTGDHGLRTRSEFESLAEPVVHGDAAFNVPFLIYAPGVLGGQVRLPYVTSHVDIAPTLLALSGIEDDPSWLRHGTNILDQRLRDRVTFMLNTNLSPVSGFIWRGCHYTLSELTGRTAVQPAPVNWEASSPDTATCDPSRDSLPEQEVRSKLEGVNRVSQRTFAYYLHSGSENVTSGW